jgi:hypothetical protein
MAIMTTQQIDAEVSKCQGTWVKRRNLRKRLISKSNAEVSEKIEEVKGKIRCLRAMGAREEDLRFWHAERTKYEVMLID